MPVVDTGGLHKLVFKDVLKMLTHKKESNLVYDPFQDEQKLA